MAKPPADTSWIRTVEIRGAPGAGLSVGVFLLGLAPVAVLAVLVL
jgi:hypothetical protein